jgi:hypothetical protein
LVGVIVDGLNLARLQAVETNHQVIALKQGGFIKLICLCADKVAVMNDGFGHSHLKFPME